MNNEVHVIDEIGFPSYLKMGLRIPAERKPCPPPVLADFASLLELARRSNELDKDTRVIGKSRRWRRDAQFKDLRRELGYDEISTQLREKEVAIAKAIYVLGDGLYDAGSHWLLVAEMITGTPSLAADVLRRLLEKRPEIKSDVLEARRAAIAAGPSFPVRLLIIERKLIAEQGETLASARGS